MNIIQIEAQSVYRSTYEIQLSFRGTHEIIQRPTISRKLLQKTTTIAENIVSQISADSASKSLLVKFLLILDSNLICFHDLIFLIFHHMRTQCMAGFFVYLL